jgi:hypothetical protein
MEYIPLLSVLLHLQQLPVIFLLQAEEQITLQFLKMEM